MKKKLSQKDKKDWENFITNNKKLENKDKIDFNLTPSYIVKSIDLHGYTLEEANHKVSDFIINCFFQGVSKINIITGKGIRSKNLDNPYQSKKLSILKYSIPEFIKNNPDLMKKILKIDFESANSTSKGSFDIILKKKKV